MKLRLVSHWRLWYRRWSVWLSALNGFFVTYVFSQPILVVGLLGFSPDGWILPLAVGLGFAAFILPVIVMHVQQPKLKAKCEELRDAPKPD